MESEANVDVVDLAYVISLVSKQKESYFFPDKKAITKTTTLFSFPLSSCVQDTALMYSAEALGVVAALDAHRTKLGGFFSSKTTQDLLTGI